MEAPDKVQAAEVLIGKPLEAHLCLEAARQHVVCRGAEAGGCANLRQQVHFEVGGEGVWQPHVAGKSAEDEVAHLDAAGRHRIAHLQNHARISLSILLVPTNRFLSSHAGDTRTLELMEQSALKWHPGIISEQVGVP